MSRWRSPEGSSWGGGLQLVCFNDQCPYYVRGWEWMQSKYGVCASYRHRHNPETGERGPLPVWSAEAMKSDIVEDDVVEEGVVGEGVVEEGKGVDS
jgi:hypothetical protein